MRTTLTLDDDVAAAAKSMAADEGRSFGAVISELARRGLGRSLVDLSGHLPVIRTPPGTPSITPQMVRRALGDD